MNKGERELQRRELKETLKSDRQKDSHSVLMIVTAGRRECLPHISPGVWKKEEWKLLLLLL
jgi:hypothetical protein